MSSNNSDFSMLDDERFEDLIEDTETFFSAFVEEVLHDVDDEEEIEEAEQVMEEVIGYVSIMLAGFNAQILSQSKDLSGNNVYELKLTMPASNLQERIRQLIVELDIDDLD
jgi:hypothetical protein